MFSVLKRRIGLILATASGLTTLFFMACYFLRTQAVVGPIVERQLRSWAERNGATLRVESMRPEGLAGFEFDRVELVVERGNIRAALRAKGLAIRPSFAALAEGRLAVGKVGLSGASVALSPLEARSRPNGDPPTRPDGDDSTTAAPVARLSGRAQQSIDVELDEVDIRARLPAGGVRTRALHVEHATFRVDPEKGLAGLRRATGWGDLPNGVGFVVSTARAAEVPDAPDTQRRVRLEPHDGLELDTLFRREIPGRFEFGAVAACPNCQTPRICLRDVRFSAASLGLQTTEACAHLTPTSIRTTADEARVRGPDGQRLGRLTAIRGHLPADGRSARFDARLRRAGAGTADVEVQWQPGAHRIDIGLQSRNLKLAPIWRAVGLDSKLRGGVLDGAFGARLYPNTELVELRGEGRIRGASIRHRLLDDAPVPITSAHLGFEATSDFRFDHLSLLEARLAAGDHRPLRLRGQIDDAGRGVAFEIEADTEGLHPHNLLEALPERIAGPALGAEIEGTFDAEFTARGHTAFPESLQLGVALEGAPKVEHESPHTQVRALATTGPPPAEVLPAEWAEPAISEWVHPETLPAHIPRVLLAAEDTQFYDHRGFSWQGIQNAMAHNLNVGRLERGGSTITQQVAKNLFLSKKRTLVRKIREAWVTWRLETVLPKERILELYLNLVEWGPDVRGLHGAATHFFERSPEALSIPQMALLSAILPGPTMYGKLIDRGYLPSSRVEKIEHILSNLKYLDMIEPSEYETIYRRAKSGTIGGLDLTVCRDDRHAPPDAPDCP